MVDLEIVCCMCGDVGFTDKLFRCNKCRHRFQHSYCTNFFYADPEIEIQDCDWCQTEAAAAPKKKPPSVTVVTINNRTNSGCSSSSSSSGGGHRGEKENCNSEKRKSPIPSPRRRYKLLKDVMC